MSSVRVTYTSEQLMILTLSDLKKVAKMWGVKGYSSMKKADTVQLVEMILRAQRGEPHGGVFMPPVEPAGQRTPPLDRMSLPDLVQLARSMGVPSVEQPTKPMLIEVIRRARALRDQAESGHAPVPVVPPDLSEIELNILDQMKVPELRAQARRMSIPGVAKMRKSDLINIIFHTRRSLGGNYEIPAAPIVPVPVPVPVPVAPTTPLAPPATSLAPPPPPEPSLLSGAEAERVLTEQEAQLLQQYRPITPSHPFYYTLSPFPTREELERQWRHRLPLNESELQYWSEQFARPGPGQGGALGADIRLEYRRILEQIRTRIQHLPLDEQNDIVGPYFQVVVQQPPPTEEMTVSPLQPEREISAVVSTPATVPRLAETPRSVRFEREMEHLFEEHLEPVLAVERAVEPSPSMEPIEPLQEEDIDRVLETIQYPHTNELLRILPSLQPSVRKCLGFV
jgi:hypothetical protein